MLTRMPGIGRKTAERLIIEMRDSVQKLAAPTAPRGNCLESGGREPAGRGLHRAGGAGLQARRRSRAC